MTLRQTLASLPRDARDTLFLLFVIRFLPRGIGSLWTKR